VKRRRALLKYDDAPPSASGLEVAVYLADEVEEGLANYAQQNERLRKKLSARLQELNRIKQERLTWAMVCDHDCPACTALDDAIRGDPPQSCDDPHK
jgi:hypothetical protein